ncbi:hypothetical protein [Promicromonospora sp. NPDC019610]|uniref:hypothetical protein n=1 Tax=Promicromonospora sp. NPDC019610 TaxID=3364405 RepID=UPI0037AD566D
MSTNTTRPGSRRLVLAGAVSVALISTVSAYLAMVGFGTDVLGMDTATAYTTAGVFELSLVTVALLAREAARDNRPGGTLLTLTWALSTASGVFAAWHEVYLGHPAGAVLFRFIVPLLAALMWHLALIGDRHLASGASWSSMRQTARMHRLFLTVEDAARVHETGTGTPAGRRAIERAEARRRKARAVALRTVPPEQMRAHVAAWLESLSAVADGTADVARMHVETNQRVAGLAVAAPVQTAPDYEARAAESVRSELESMTGPDRSTNRSARRSPVRSGNRSKLRRSTVRSGADRADRSARLAVVSGLLDQTPDASGPDALAALAAAGHEVSDGYARKLLREARATTTDQTTDEAPATATPDVVVEAVPVLVEA